MFTCPTCRKQYQSRQGLRNHRAKSCAPRSTDSFTGRDMLEGRLSRPSRGECNLTTRKAKAGWRFSKPGRQPPPGHGDAGPRADARAAG
jgi:hypothetical protein